MGKDTLTYYTMGRTVGNFCRLPAGVLAVVACTALLLMSSGCATAPRVPSVEESSLPTSPLSVVFQPGDVIEVKFRFWSDLDEVQTIRPDGMISLQLVHEVKAEGMTPEELRRELLSLYADKLKDPEIAVFARVEENRMVHVGGEVNSTRNTDGLVAIPIIGRLTVMEAIVKAGGLRNSSAKISNVLIIRRMNGKQYARTLDLREVFKNAESEPFYLQPNDIVFVPRTKIDRIDQWVDQYLNKTVPNWVNMTLDLNDVFDINNSDNSSSSSSSSGSTNVIQNRSSSTPSGIN